MSIARKILMGAAGVSGEGTYVDDVFHTEVFVSSNQNADYKVTNNIDNSGEGGLLWYKDRIGTSWHLLWDTERGSNKYIYSNDGAAESTSELLKSFDSDGYTIKTGTSLLDPARKNVLWNFRKAPGFFDVVTYTGNSTNRTIAHSLGCVPGMILIKNVSASENWRVYHRATKATHNLQLNDTDAAGASSTPFNNTEPTASVFSVGTDGATNNNGDTIVAYLFAGGASTAATARSVDFTPNASANLELSGSSDFEPGTGDYSIEAWINTTFTGTTRQIIFYSGGADNGSLTLGIAADQIYIANYNAYILQANTGYGANNLSGQWIHVAACRSGSTLKIFKNGIEVASGTSTNNWNTSAGSTAKIGQGGTMGVKGKLSNVRFVKGTAVYTSSFRPPYEPLTNITNTKLLCCNNSSASGATVTPNTITATNSAAASTDNPFDDPEGFQFGEGGDQNLIKTGSYLGNGSSTGPEIYLGWEPQWVMIKISSGATYGWTMLDTMRGIPTGGNNARLRANESGAEDTAMGELINVTPTGFQLKDSTDSVNASGNTYIYVAIRRPDGYVGKPPEAGTDAFNQAYGANSGDFRFTSGFPVDFGWAKLYAGSGNWWTSARLIQGRELKTNNTDAGQAGTNKVFDSNVGWHAPNADNTYISHMWKRGAGFDVVTYDGSTTLINDVRHSLNAVPEMMWIKAISGQYAGSANWFVYHKDLNGGTNPEYYNLNLNTSGAEGSAGLQYWQRQPTSTVFTHGNTGGTGYTGWTYINILFASVEGISKVGSYTGTGVSGLAVTTGFTPRFLIIKNASWSHGDWFVYDTTRGWTSGTDAVLVINSTAAQSTAGTHATNPTSTGFTIESTDAAVNANGNNFVYYAHA